MLLSKPRHPAHPNIYVCAERVALQAVDAGYGFVRNALITPIRRQGMRPDWSRSATATIYVGLLFSFSPAHNVTLLSCILISCPLHGIAVWYLVCCRRVAVLSVRGQVMVVCSSVLLFAVIRALYMLLVVLPGLHDYTLMQTTLMPPSCSTAVVILLHLTRTLLGIPWPCCTPSNSSRLTPSKQMHICVCFRSCLISIRIPALRARRVERGAASRG